MQYFFHTKLVGWSFCWEKHVSPHAEKRCAQRMVKSISSEVLHNHTAPQTEYNPYGDFCKEIRIQATPREKNDCLFAAYREACGKWQIVLWELAYFGLLGVFDDTALRRWACNWNLMYFGFGLDIETLCFTVTGIGLWCFYGLVLLCCQRYGHSLWPNKGKSKSRERWERDGREFLRYVWCTIPYFFQRLFYIWLRGFVVVS